MFCFFLFFREGCIRPFINYHYLIWKCIECIKFNYSILCIKHMQVVLYHVSTIYGTCGSFLLKQQCNSYWIFLLRLFCDFLQPIAWYGNSQRRKRFNIHYGFNRATVNHSRIAFETRHHVAFLRQRVEFHFLRDAGEFWTWNTFPLTSKAHSLYRSLEWIKLLIVCCD